MEGLRNPRIAFLRGSCYGEAELDVLGWLPRTLRKRVISNTRQETGE